MSPAVGPVATRGASEAITTLARDAAVLSPAGPEAHALADVIGTVLIVCALCFLLAMGLLAAALWWRGRRTVSDGWWLWGGGVVLPVFVFGGLLLHSHLRSAGLDDPPPPDALTVGVTGHLWWWQLRYEADGDTPAFATANELRVPVGRTVRLTLASADVIHSLWVPALGGKMDLVPGRLNRLSFTADRPGVFRGPCAEYCGTQHAGMILQVVAMAPDDFERWRRAQLTPSVLSGDVEPGGGAARVSALRGRALFAERGCAACHTVRGHHEAAREGMGPDLTHVADRLWLGAGTLRNRSGREALRLWIADVQAVKPGARMPGYRHLPPEDVDALAAFLEAGR